MDSLAQAGSAEVETKHRQAEAGERLGRVIDDLVVHRPAAQRVRMRHDGSVQRIVGASIEDGFEPPCGAA